MGYRLNTFKYGVAANQYTHKKDVLNRFYDDMSNCEPCTVECRKKTVMIAFYDGKYTAQYILPIEYKMLFDDSLSSFIANLSYYLDNDSFENLMSEYDAKINIECWKKDGVELPEGLTVDLLMYGIKEYL